MSKSQFDNLGLKSDEMVRDLHRLAVLTGLEPATDNDGKYDQNENNEVGSRVVAQLLPLMNLMVRLGLLSVSLDRINNPAVEEFLKKKIQSVEFIAYHACAQGNIVICAGDYVDHKLM